MRFRLAAATSCALILFAACGGGDDGGSSGGDDGGGDDGGGNNDGGTQDMYVPPEVNCTALDLANAPAIEIETGAVTINPQGGAVTSGTFRLSTIKLDVILPVEGTAAARAEIVAGNATSGAARIAVSIDAEAIGEQIMEETGGAGTYTLSGPNLMLADGCGGSSTLPPLTYTANGNNLTMWTTYSITDPIPLDIPIELGLVRE